MHSHGHGPAPRGGRERSQRQLRVGEAIRHALVEMLMRGEVRDPGLSGASVTVTEVKVSPDMRNATAFVLPLGGENTDEVLAALRRAAPYLRRLLGRALTLRHLPALSFQADTAFDYGDRMDRILRSEEVRRDLHSDAEGEEDEGGDGA
jgi:ribosome-binding factor A